MASASPVSTRESNKTLVRRYYEELDRSGGAGAVIEQFFRGDATIHFAPMPTMDLAGYKGLGPALWGAFPDLKHGVEAEIAEGDDVVARLNVTGTHRGEYQGVAATGRRVEFTAMIWMHVTGGRVAEYRVNADLAGLMQQLTAAVK